VTPQNDGQLIGQTLQGRWRVLKRLGGGGMGTVYLAEQISMGGRPVALKVLHSEYSRDPEFVRRFHFEAQQAGRINDPRIVTVYDFGQTDDGDLFLVMEYVVGKTLKDLVKQGPLSLERSMKFAIQLAEALETVHSAGIVHRDVKGDNAIVRDGREELKLMDFGIAKPTDDEGRTWKTHTGIIVGTPRYMAPEQIEHGTVSPRTDIYSWGIVFYEMLTGDAPFSAPTPTSLLLKHLNETPQPVRERRPEVSLALERVILSALEKRPEDRPQSMTEVIAALQGLDPRAKAERAGDVTSVETVISEKRYEVRRKPRARLGWVGLAVGVASLVVLAALQFMTRPRGPLLEEQTTAGALIRARQRERQVAETRSQPDPRIREHLTMGKFFADRGEYDEAIGEYQAALELEPGNGDASKGIDLARSAQAAERKVMGE
jgi:serine/threonine-protein kinase